MSLCCFEHRSTQAINDVYWGQAAHRGCKEGCFGEPTGDRLIDRDGVEGRRDTKEGSAAQQMDRLSSSAQHKVWAGSLQQNLFTFSQQWQRDTSEEVRVMTSGGEREERRGGERERECDLDPSGLRGRVRLMSARCVM